MTAEKSHIQRRVQSFCDAARRSGLRVTRQRQIIFEEIAKRADHPDAESVFSAVRAQLPSVSMDTVYRTLRTLCDQGLLTEVAPRNDSVRFDPNLAPHHHYVCNRCGQIRDFSSEDLNLPAVEKGAASLGTIVSSQVVVRGVCRACALKLKSTSRTAADAL